MPKVEEDLEAYKSKWVDLLDQEERTFQLLCELDLLDPAPSKEKAEATRRWWLTINALLWMFIRVRAQYGHELQPYPAFPLGRLANISDELGHGVVPKMVEYARLAGRPLYLKERQHLAYAVLYIECAWKGEINDRAPNKTVRRVYNVTAKAVQGWMKRRDDLVIRVPYKSLSPEEIANRMHKAGELYSRIGRGAPSDN